MKVPFVKMQALGNDFILLDCLGGKFPINSEFIRILCDRRKGVGADQLLVLMPSQRADFRMQIFNADGGEVEMCGNGIRCLARYLLSRGLAGGEEQRIETRAGIIRPRVEGDLVMVDMGRPMLAGGEVPVKLTGLVVDREVTVGESVQRITCVSMGNPHCVIFVDDLERYPVAQIGPRIEKDKLFPNRVNVEFVKVVSPELIEMRVWERGTGETMACGTGACAAVVACCLNKKTGREVTVRLRGGDLKVAWGDSDHIFMSGPAFEVFKGEIDVERQ
ncbi:MAG: diaminopimelate epimerase [Candidatus Aureabacteria bacterium]|nr:diaminopimelate epimerase [Candidatus Auribacterota bacterium]